METIEETYEAQHNEMQRVEGRVRKLMFENKDLKSWARDMAVKLSRRTRSEIEK